MSENMPLKNYSIPVQMTDLSIFDDAFTNMKERFAAEMKRVDEEMNKFGTDLVRFYGESATVQTGVTSTQKENPATSWEAITSSPLVEGEGESKSLKLQFDVSQFDASEVSVSIVNDILVVSGAHEEKTDNTTVYREYHREFLLPKGIDPETIISSLSREGVLTVKVPLPQNTVSNTPRLGIGSK